MAIQMSEVRASSTLEIAKEASHMTRTRLLLTGVSLICLLLLGTGCSSIMGSFGHSGAASRPQSGEWKATLTYPGSGGQDVTWTLVFTVSEDGKQIDNAQAMHYLGKLTSDTQVTVLMALQPEEIEGDSFSISFTDFSGYATYTRTFEGTFTSPSEATGTLQIRGETYSWTATPVAAE